MIMRLLFSILMLSAITATAAPYENLAYALNEKTLVKDLRAQCQINPAVSDEKVKSVFINSQVNHTALSAAASALKQGKDAQYQQQLSTIRCPDFSRD